jgi:hypothetical protein
MVPVNNVLWSIKIGGTQDGKTDWIDLGWKTAAEASASNAPCYSSPFIFVTGPARVLFATHGSREGGSPSNRLFRRLYSTAGVFSKTGGTTSTALASGFTGMDDPRSSPIVINVSGQVYAFAGDGGGYVNRFPFDPATASFGTRSTFPSGGVSLGASIDSPVLVDVLGGNIYFGADNGRVYQIGQVSLQ